MATVLLTGVAGFIGSHVAERLLFRGDQVIGVDNFDPFYSRVVKQRNLHSLLSHPKMTFVEGDLRNPSLATSLLTTWRPHAVVHLAAKAGVRPSLEQPVAYVEANISATLNLLTACSAAPPRHFVFASSSSVYGDSTPVPFSEEARTDEPQSPYAATKKSGEVHCYTYHQLLGIPVTCLRFFTVFGPRQRPDLAIHRFTRLMEQGLPIPVFGDGSTSRDYTFVDDIADGILAALDQPDGYQIYNLGNSRPTSLLGMVHAIERATGREAQIEWQPRQAGDVQRTYADIRKARRCLGYEPKVDFQTGVDRFVDWYRSEHSDLATAELLECRRAVSKHTTLAS